MSKRNKRKEKDEEEVTTLPGTIDITRSYSRKLNLSAHGGEQFETVDISESRTAKEVVVDQAQEVSEYLYKGCVDSVESAIKAYDEMMLGEQDEEDAPKKKKKKATSEIDEDKVEFSEIKDQINELLEAESIKELNKTAKAIADNGELTKKQIAYLTKLYAKRKDELTKVAD